MDTSRMSAEQIELVAEGRALAGETSLPVLLVAVANKVAGDGSIGNRDAAKMVALATALFSLVTTPVKGAVARRPKQN